MELLPWTHPRGLIFSIRIAYYWRYMQLSLYTRQQTFKARPCGRLSFLLLPLQLLFVKQFYASCNRYSISQFLNICCRLNKVISLTWILHEATLQKILHFRGQLPFQPGQIIPYPIIVNFYLIDIVVEFGIVHKYEFEKEHAYCKYVCLIHIEVYI